MLNLLDSALSLTPMFMFVIADLQKYFIRNVWVLQFVQEVSVDTRAWALSNEGLCSYYATKLPLSSLRTSL
jgi:hypothetical protein